jgi:cytosolic carboxypeptidase protein 6
MSFVFCFDHEDDVYQFSYSFPYSYTKLQNYLQILDSRNLDFYERELLATSVVRVHSIFFICSLQKIN